MKSLNLNMVMKFTEAWVYFYTIGLPEKIRKARQDEINSDIWEHLQDLRRENKSLTEIIGRLLRGMPADIIWRLNQSEATIARVFISLPRSCLKVLVVLAGIFVVLPIVMIGLVITLFMVIALGFIIAFPFYHKTGILILGTCVVNSFGEVVIASMIGLALLSLIVLLIWSGFRFAGRYFYLRIGRLHTG